MRDGAILIVDDDPSIRDFIAQFLGGEGYAVEVAPNGARALALIERTPVALVLLDMRMPVLDGWGLARALVERGLQPPLVVMTAAYGAHARNWALEIGAVALLAKPFDLNDLLAIVESVTNEEPPSSSGLPPSDRERAQPPVAEQSASQRLQFTSEVPPSFA